MIMDLLSKVRHHIQATLSATEENRLALAVQGRALLRELDHMHDVAQAVAWQRRFKHSTNGTWTDWEFSRLAREEFQYKFGYLVERGECEVRELYASQPSHDTIIEQCAKIAEPWSGFMTGDKMGAMDSAIVEVREEIAAAIRSLASQPSPAATVETDDITGALNARQAAINESMAHNGSSAATARDTFFAVLKRYGSQPYTHVAIDAAWSAAVATINEPQPAGVPVDQVARSLALSYGRDPDAMTDMLEMCDAHNRPVPVWRVYEEQAEALLAAYSITRPLSK